MSPDAQQRHTDVYRHPTQWLTAAQAAVYLKLALGTIRNLTSERRIPFAKRGGIVRYNRASLDAWLESGACRGRKTVANEPARGADRVAEGHRDKKAGGRKYGPVPTTGRGRYDDDCNTG